MREMKDSGIEWIGEIPREWEMTKLKNTFEIISGATPKGDNPQFWDGDIAWITPADFKTSNKYVDKGKKHITTAGYESCSTTIVPLNSLIFTKRAPIGEIAITSNNVCTNQGCLACVIKKECNIMFYYYSLSVFSEQFELLGSGTTFKEISANSFANFNIVNPPLQTQQRIADYLDKKCSEIDSVIEKTKATIEEYKKLKQSVITQAVTKGLNADVEMKDSGVCLTPSHWKIQKIKYLLEERAGRSINGQEEPLSMSQVHGILPTKDMERIPNMATSFVNAKLVYKEDLVFNKLKAHLGVFAVSKYDGLVSPDYAVYFEKNNTNVQFLEYLFKTEIYISEFKKASTGIAQGLMRLYTNGLFNIKVALPSTAEQGDIVEYIAKKCKEIDLLIEKKQTIVAELESYKKSLIYECVTGKVEV